MFPLLAHTAGAAGAAGAEEGFAFTTCRASTGPKPVLSHGMLSSDAHSPGEQPLSPEEPGFLHTPRLELGKAHHPSPGKQKPWEG